MRRLFLAVRLRLRAGRQHASGKAVLQSQLLLLTPHQAGTGRASSAARGRPPARTGPGPTVPVAGLRMRVVVVIRVWEHNNRTCKQAVRLHSVSPPRGPWKGSGNAMLSFLVHSTSRLYGRRQHHSSTIDLTRHAHRQPSQDPAPKPASRALESIQAKRKIPIQHAISSHRSPNHYAKYHTSNPSP